MTAITSAHAIALPTPEALEAKHALAPREKDAAIPLGKGPKKVAGTEAGKLDPRLEKVAHEFEAIFLRNLLKPLEGAGAMGKQGHGTVTSGTGVYGSMMVGALADSASEGGGIGLAHMVLEALTRGSVTPKQSK
jgi:Rod binding domain-containing protein